MLKDFNVRFSDLILSLSDAIDIANPMIALHQMRTSYIVWKIAILADLPDNEVERLYLAALLHDIGALSLEEKIQLRMGFDEIDADVHCILGETIFNLSPLLKPSSKIIRYHHTKWVDLKDELSKEVKFHSQILHLADVVERLIDRNTYILHQVSNIKSKIKSMSGETFNPEVVDIFINLSYYEDFWLDLVSPRLYSIMAYYCPFQKQRIKHNDIFLFSTVFGHVIDFKSRFTATHSTGVAESAVLLADYLGFTKSEREQLEIAGYLHDLGKLAVPNYILEKNGRLTREEFDIVKQHPYFTYSVLSRISNIGLIPEWAAFHHEKFDGSGYPFHVTETKINLGSRIMQVADIFTALIEDRPYREGMPPDKIKKILSKQANANLLDKRMVDITIDNFDYIFEKVKLKQRESRKIFEEKFLKIKTR